MEVISQPTEVQTTSSQWWFIYSGTTLIQQPLQCSGKTSSPHTIVIADTKQECDDYIAQNNLS